MTSQQQLVCDSSTLANFKQWAQAISSFFTTSGWAQSSDTGQVNWSTLSAVPGNGAYVYEIWQPNDGLTNFYLRVEYGNQSGSTNCPSLRISASATTNGAGLLTGTVTSLLITTGGTYTAPSSTATYECDFSGAPGRFGALMWRNGTNNCQQYIAIERSLNSSGAYTGSHVTLICGGNPGGSDWTVHQQQTLGLGVAFVSPVPAKGTGSGASYPGLAVRRLGNSGGSGAANGGIPFDTVAPMVGFFDYPLTVIGVGPSPDISEGVTFAITLYGATRTYMPTKGGYLHQVFNSSYADVALCVRYD